MMRKSAFLNPVWTWKMCALSFMSTDENWKCIFTFHFIFLRFLYKPIPWNIHLFILYIYDNNYCLFFGIYYVYWIKLNPSDYVLMKSKRNFNRSYQTCYGYNENCSIAKFLILNRQIQIRKNTKVMDRVIR